jgi:hypothetical protein
LWRKRSQKAEVDVGLPTPAHVYDEVDFEWSDIGLRH